VFGFDDSTIFFLIGIGVAAAVALIVVAARAAGRRRLEKLGPAFELGTARLPSALSSSVEGIYLGYTCRYTIEQRSQYSPGGATLRVRAASTMHWSASKADLGSRLMTNLGILKDVEIGDAELDERLRFTGSDRTSLLTVFGQTRTLEALRELVRSENFASIVVRDQRTDIKWAPRHPELDDDPDAVRQRLAKAVDVLAACSYPPTMG
jgi:hypothetical protein